MLKLLASAALGATLATAAFAQTEAPAVDPAADTAAPASPGMMAPAAPAEMSGDWVTDENFHPVEVGMLTAEQIIGANVRNADGETVASVSDLVLGADGKAESVAAKFGGFLGFGSNTVLLTLDEVEFMQNDSGTVALRSAVSPELLADRPDYAG